MSFISITFAFFFLIFIIAYYACPKKFRYAVVLAAGYVFYAYKDVKLALILLFITLSTYLGGFLIDKYRKKGLLWLFGGINILILAFFKYTNFAIEEINALLGRFKPEAAPVDSLDIIIPIGLSFIIFQSYTYLTDVYFKKMKPEKNFALYAAFVSFFPSLLSGPIQKARELIPQLRNPGVVDETKAKQGTLLFVWGFFEKVMISNRLIGIITPIFYDCNNYGSAANLMAAILFSIYIYADFASYSDMARGIAMVMGIDIGKNFDNPYLAKSTSEFWNRWHMSLNSWLLENIYIPLGGNRKGELRKYVNIFIVFFISGLWHGASNHFVVWGVLNGIIVIIGRLLVPVKKKIYGALKVDDTCESIVFLKRAGVFALITFTWIFFQNGFMQSMVIIRKILSVTLLDFFSSDFVNMAESLSSTVVLIVVLYVFYRIQMKRQDEKKFFESFAKQPFLIQCAIVAVVLYVCILAACSAGGSVSNNYVYFQF